MNDFATVVAAVDGTRAGFEAVRQAACLVEPDGRLLIVAVEDGRDMLAASWGGVRFASLDERGEWTLARREQELRARIDATLARAAEQAAGVPRVETRRAAGWPWEVVGAIAEEEGAGLIAVGTHGRSRALGILLGQTATHLAHEAPCSVLIARPPYDPRRFPASLVVGFDGSPPSERALDVAFALALRYPELKGQIRAYRPMLPGLLELEVAPRVPPNFDFAVDRQMPDDGLVEAAEAADLLVVGARGLTGMRALGSTSERVAHRASSSVLVARG